MASDQLVLEERKLTTGALKNELLIGDLKTDLSSTSVVLQHSKLFDLASGRVENILPGQIHGGTTTQSAPGDRLRKVAELRSGMAVVFVEPKRFHGNDTHRFWFSENVEGGNTFTNSTDTTENGLKIKFATEYDPRVMALVTRRGTPVSLQFDTLRPPNKRKSVVLFLRGLCVKISGTRLRYVVYWEG